MTKYKINITQRAFSDISECVLFVKKVSSKATKELYLEIITAINSLSSFPNKYSEIKDLTIRNVMVRKMPIHNGRYIILYKVETETVVIYDVIDARKDASWINL